LETGRRGVAAANQFAQLAKVGGGWNPSRWDVRTAEPRDQCCVELVRLVAREFAVAIGLDACWIDNADPHLLSV